jgi:hypothetical protein
MKPDKISTLLEKYYAGQTSIDEEMELRNALKPIDQVPEQFKPDAEIFAMMDALASDITDLNVTPDREEPPVIPLAQHSTGIQYTTWMMRVAAGFALLAVGVLGGWMIGQQGTAQTEVAELRQDIDEVKQMVALAQLRKESASERIMATYEFKKMDSASDEILDALIYTFNNDENPNVKNAAADALFKFGNHDKVRKAFINGLTRQSDPVLQIKLIDMLVELDEKRALPKLQEVMQEETHMMVVKQKAAQGMGKLL